MGRARVVVQVVLTLGALCAAGATAAEDITAWGSVSYGACSDRLGGYEVDYMLRQSGKFTGGCVRSLSRWDIEAVSYSDKFVYACGGIRALPDQFLLLGAGVRFLSTNLGAQPDSASEWVPCCRESATVPQALIGGFGTAKVNGVFERDATIWGLLLVGVGTLEDRGATLVTTRVSAGIVLWRGLSFAQSLSLDICSGADSSDPVSFAMVSWGIGIGVLLRL